jgi:hypothetical protein
MHVWNLISDKKHISYSFVLLETNKNVFIYIYITINIYREREIIIIIIITEHKNHCVADSMSNFWDAFGPSKKLSMTSQSWYSIIQEKLQESLPSPSLSLPHPP